MCETIACKIYIFYHYKEREYDGCSMIAASIKRANPRAQIVIEEFFEGLRLALMDRPDCILTFLPRNKKSSDYLTIVKYLSNCAVLSLMNEGFFQNLSEEVVQLEVGTNEYSRHLVDKYLFWGDKTRKCFVDILIKNRKIASKMRAQTVGYVYYDVECVKNFFKERDLPDQISKWKNNFNKRALVLTGFNAAEYSKDDMIGISGFRYYGVKGKEKEYVYEVRKFEKIKEKFFEYRKKYLECIIRLAKENSDVGILVKLHPTELKDFLNGGRYQCYRELEQYDNIILLTESVLIGRILPIADVVIHYGSTSGLEAYIYGVPTVQMYDKTYLEKAGEPGFCIYDSTIKMDVNAPDAFAKIMEDKIDLRQIESVETVLAEQFNWIREKRDKYHPVETYAQILLDSVGHGQKIEEHEYKLALQSTQGQNIKTSLIAETIRFLLCGKVKKAIKHQRLLAELDMSIMECIRIFLYFINKRIKKSDNMGNGDNA